MNIDVPTILNTSLTIETVEKPESIDQQGIESENNSDTKIEEKHLNDLTIPSILTVAEYPDQDLELESNSSLTEQKYSNIMAQILTL